MGSGWLSEEDFTLAMRDSKDAFLQELSKQMEESNLGMTIAVIPQFNSLRLVIGVRFVDADSFNIIDINHIVFEHVGEGTKAITNIC